MLPARLASASAGTRASSACVLGSERIGRRADRGGGPACGAAPPPGATGRPARGRRCGSTSGTGWPRNSAGRVYCGYSSSPATNDSSAPDASLPITPGTRRATASITTSRGRFAARQHVVADRQLAVAQVVGHPLVDALVAAAQQREARARRPARRAYAWSKGRPAADSRSSGRGGSTASTAAKIGSGAITIPAPPP